MNEEGYRLRRKRRWNRTDFLLLVCIALLLAAVIWFAVLLRQRAQAAAVLCQSVVPLGEYTYDEAFLEEARKIRGIRSITPVLEIPVRLRAEDYVMDTVWYGVDLEDFRMKLRQAEDTAAGSAPVLWIGEKSLAGMTDANGHALSEQKQREFLSRYSEITWSYQQTEGGAKEHEAAGQTDSGMEAQGWLPCTVAGILSEPADMMYLSFTQAAALAGLLPAGTEGEIGSGSAAGAVTKILLTVQGKENYEKALVYFEEK